VDAQGTPLAVHTTPAHVRDDQAVQGVLGRLAAMGLRVGSLHGDAGYGFVGTARQVEAAGIEPVLTARGLPADWHDRGLGVIRRVIEQSLAHLGGFRRLKLCYERTGAFFQALHELAATLLCFKRLQHYTGGL
jgi:transposase